VFGLLGTLTLVGLAIVWDASILAIGAALPLLAASALAIVLRVLVRGAKLDMVPLGIGGTPAAGAGFGGPWFNEGVLVAPYAGGTVEQLRVDAIASGARAVIVWEGGSLYLLRLDVDAPENVAFYEAFQKGIQSGTTVILLEDISPSRRDSSSKPSASDNEIAVGESRTPYPVYAPPFAAYGVGMSPNDVIDVVVDGEVISSTEADEEGNWLIQIPASSFYQGATARFFVNGRESGVEQQLRAGGAPRSVAEGIDLSAVRGSGH
jgi:hypothetical protein